MLEGLVQRLCEVIAKGEQKSERKHERQIRHWERACIESYCSSVRYAERGISIYNNYPIEESPKPSFLYRVYHALAEKMPEELMEKARESID